MTRSSVVRRWLTWPKRTWQVVRALSGDDAYERYLEHCREHHAGSTPLGRRAFYLCEQERRYRDGPTGCC